ncbi:MAG: NUDIX domain-containing protein [Gammaproteobacteria bacterium]|nr:NUDIX domain-containing protein [Gammaproteobacteria bacterium]
MSIKPPTFNNEDMAIFEKEQLSSGFLKVTRFTLKHKLFAGTWSEPFVRELITRHDAVAVLPYDPKLDKVVLIEQFRIGCINRDDSPWSLELVAGIIDKNNSKEEIAIMECQEEAGLTIQKLIPIYDYFSSPGGSTEKVQVYCALVDSTKAHGIHGIKKDNEDIMVHTCSSADAFNAVKSGRINNAISIIALQWLELNKDSLCRQNLTS